MVYPISARAKARVGLESTTWSKLFRFSLRDGTYLRLTNHTGALLFDEAQDGVLRTYEAEGSPIGASTRSNAEVVEATSQLGGFVLESAAITLEAIRAGLFTRAKVDIWTVDWRYPWAGHVAHKVFWMGDIEVSAEQFTAPLKDLLGQLDKRQGRIHGKHCDANVYDDRCGVNRAGFTYSGTVTKVVSMTDGLDNPYLRFETDLTTGTTPDGWLRDGQLEWTSGDNFIVGLSAYDIKQNKRTDGVIDLWTPMPYAAQVGDTFQAYAGCNREANGHCRVKFSNIENHRGFQFMPTVRALLKTPNKKE